MHLLSHFIEDFENLMVKLSSGHTHFPHKQMGASGSIVKYEGVSES